MKTSRLVLIAAVLAAVALSAAESAAAPIFASPPHVVADEDGRRIVLFLNEPVSGALAARAGSGYEVRVPRSEVAPAIQGQDFGADGWGNGGDSVRHLVLATGAAGDTSIRIEPSAPVGGLDAHTLDDPPRLVIELLAAAPTKMPAPTKTPSRTPASAPTRSAAKATKTPTKTATPRPTATAKAPLPLPSATPVPEPVAIAEAPSAEALARATVLTALALDAAAGHPGAGGTGTAKEATPPHATGAEVPDHASKAGLPTEHVEGEGRASGRPSADPAALSTAAAALPAAAAPSGAHPSGASAKSPAAAAPPVAAPAIGTLLGASAAAPAAAPAALVPAKLAPPSASSPTASYGLGCLWRRFAGLAICVADPKSAPYVGDHTITAMVGALARGKLPEAEDTPQVATPALAYLTADVAFVTRAPEGKLLPVVDAYRSALRQHPDFPDAWRARLNIALAYRAMEFLTEVQTVAKESAVDRSAGLVRGLAGDLAFVTDKTAIASDEYRRAADVGGLGTCVAARGRARLALAAHDPAAAAAELEAVGSLCPAELASDPETQWVRGRLALARQDVAAARTLLDEAEKGLGKGDAGAVIADLGAVAEAAGDPKTARTIYERLLAGTYGARAARQATVQLAILDGVGGDVTGGLKRLDRLTPEAADPARRALVMQTVRTALARGAGAEAIAAIHDAHVDATQLAFDDQMAVAQAYREIGLIGEAERVLAAAAAKAGAPPPDALFAERGTVALARRDAAASLAVADEWIRAHGRNAGALALKARAAALAGDGIGAHAAVAAAVLEDDSLTRTLGLDVAEDLRDRDPAAALVLAREALEPGPAPALPVAREAAGLALVGALAEAAGDDDTALAAFTTLTARYGKEPIAADAAYRAARLAARRVPGGAPGAYEEAARSKDPLARRVAGAARDYETIVKPFAGPAPAAGGAKP